MLCLTVRKYFCLIFYLESQIFYILSIFRRLKSKTQVFWERISPVGQAKFRNSYFKIAWPKDLKYIFISGRNKFPLLFGLTMGSIMLPKMCVLIHILNK